VPSEWPYEFVLTCDQVWDTFFIYLLSLDHAKHDTTLNLTISLILHQTKLLSSVVLSKLVQQQWLEQDKSIGIMLVICVARSG
jgi:hypothetical protein